MVSLGDPFSKIGFPPILQGSQASTVNDNATPAANDSSSPFPPGIMDNLLMTAGRSSPILQVALFVYRVLGAQFGLDPSVLLTVVGFLWGLSKLGSQLWQHLSGLVDRHLMCAMYVSEGDQIYTHMMKWLSEHPVVAGSQYLTAQTVWKSAWEDNGEGEESWESLLLTDGGDGGGSNRYLNFSNQEARLVSPLALAPCLPFRLII
jgi:mitochondrial chaperone BCS1